MQSYNIDWEKKSEKHCNELWPGWDKRLEEVEKNNPGFRKKIKNISESIVS